MRFSRFCLLIALLFVFSIVVSYLAQQPLPPDPLSSAALPHHVGPDYLYPNATLTPGAVDTQSFAALTQTYTDHCPNGKTSCTYSQDHRNVSAQEISQVCKEYPDNCKVVHEIDHFCPLALGCTNDIKNLWAQPEQNLWNGQDFGFHTKDKLETLLAARMKSGNITPKDAQGCIIEDWIACYEFYFPTQQLGAAAPAIDPDNQ